jgi:cytochrome c-type biogenesis protein CcmH
VRALIVLAVLFLGLTSGALAVQPDEVLPDRKLEERARNISTGLRCLVCQNQSIDDSDAPLARDLRLLVRERLVAGDSDSGVRDFVVSRYGEFVLLRPPFSASTIFLWISPIVVLVLGALTLFVARRRATPALSTPGLDSDEQKRLEALLRDKGA